MHYAPLTRDKSALYKTFLVDCGFLFPNAYISSSHLVSLGHTLLPNKCILLPILTYPCRTLQKVSHHNPHNPDLQIAFFFQMIFGTTYLMHLSSNTSFCQFPLWLWYVWCRSLFSFFCTSKEKDFELFWLMEKTLCTCMLVFSYVFPSLWMLSEYLVVQCPKSFVGF